MMKYVLLIVGFVLLIKGADFFVEGSAAVAKKLKVPTMIIGLTIVAMGTSAPECAVSIAASVKGSNAMAISNVVGSNIFNLMVVCGVCALFTPLAVQARTLKQEFPFSILAAVVMLITGFIGMTLGRVDGVILVVFFIFFLIWMVKAALSARENVQDEEEDVKDMGTVQCILFILGGLAAVVFGGDLVVDASTEIARAFGLSENLIGLTIVAFGTSLPELVTSIIAAKKGQVDMALGNVIGSNIFNIFLVAGVAAVVSPMAFLMENVIDLIILTAMSILVWSFAATKKKIGRAEGAFMLIIYIAYLVYICNR